MKNNLKKLILFSLLPLLITSCGERRLSFDTVFGFGKDLNTEDVNSIRFIKYPGSIAPLRLIEYRSTTSKKEIEKFINWKNEALFVYADDLIAPGEGRVVHEIEIENKTNYFGDLKRYNPTINFPALNYEEQYFTFETQEFEFEMRNYQESQVVPFEEIDSIKFILKENVGYDYFDITVDAILSSQYSEHNAFIEDPTHFIFNYGRYEVISENNFGKYLLKDEDKTNIVHVKDEFGELLFTLKVSRNYEYSVDELQKLLRMYTYRYDAKKLRKSDSSTFKFITFTEDTNLILVN